MFFKLCRPLITLWLWLFYPMKIYGKENLIQEGNTVVICNHLCKVDVPYIGYLFRGKSYYIAKKEWFDKHPIRAWLFDKLGGIPLDREHTDLACIKTSLKLLKSGKRLCIFPEGTRNRTGTTEIQPLHGGAGMFAFKTGAKIVPINIHHKAGVFRKNYIYIGKPYDFSEYQGMKLDNELNEKLTDIMYKSLCNAREELLEILRAEDEKKALKKRGKRK